VRSAPACGTAAGLVLPRCNTAAMALHLAEISQAVEPGCHAVLLLDQAGWHLSDKLAIPDNITLMPLPAKSPELKSDRKHLAVHARQLALQPDIPVLRRYPRPLLPRLEQAGRPALDHHVHRLARLGASVLISESWYQSTGRDGCSHKSLRKPQEPVPPKPRRRRALGSSRLP